MYTINWITCNRFRKRERENWTKIVNWLKIKERDLRKNPWKIKAKKIRRLKTKDIEWLLKRLRENNLLKKRKVGKKEKRIKKNIKKRTIKTSINPLIRVKSTKKVDEQPLTKEELLKITNKIKRRFDIE